MVVLLEMPPLLLELWREQHPAGHEQIRLDFQVRVSPAKAVRLFVEQDRFEPSGISTYFYSDKVMK